MTIFLQLITIVLVIGAVLLASALLIWVERRLLGLWQERYGPNRLGPAGLLQVVADLIKIMAKEDWIPPYADRVTFVIAPAIVVLTGMMVFAVVPFAPNIQVAQINVGLLFFLGMSSLGVYSQIVSGWAANNKYALLGSLRASAQTLSYEVFMGLSLMGVVMLAGSFDLGRIVEAQKGLWFCVPQFFGLVVFLIAGLAETHRLPFDLPEAETELTAGYHTDYAGLKFGLFFVGEYLGIILISTIAVVLFFGGGDGPLLPDLVWFVLKTSVLVVLFILARAALPRVRYDQLMAFGWKLLLPITLLNLAVTGAVVVAR